MSAEYKSGFHAFRYLSHYTSGLPLWKRLYIAFVARIRFVVSEDTTGYRK